MTSVVRNGSTVQIGERITVEFGRGNQQLAHEFEQRLRLAQAQVTIDGEPA